MFAKTLNHVCCPECNGELSADGISSVEAAGREDWFSGVLRCTECSLTYPIIDGVALLVSPKRRNQGVFSSESVNLIDRSRVTTEQLEFVSNAAPKHLGAGSSAHDYYFALTSHFLELSENGEHIEDGFLREMFVSLANRVDETFSIEATISNSSRVVDLAGGLGATAFEIAKVSEATVLSCDIAFDMTLIARRMLLSSEFSSRINERANIDFIVHDATQPSVIDSEWDVVISENLIDVVLDPIGCVNSSCKLLATKGVLHLTSPFELRAEIARKIGVGPASEWGIVIDRFIEMHTNVGLKLMHMDRDVPWIISHTPRCVEVRKTAVLSFVKETE